MPKLTMDKKEFNSLVKGMTTQQLINFVSNNVSDLTRDQIAVISTKMASTANKRLQTLLKKYEATQAIIGLANAKGQQGNYTYPALKFSVKGKDLNSLREQYIQMKNFLNAKTSTVKGYNDVMQKTLNTLEADWGIRLTRKQYDIFWRTYERLKEIDPSLNVRRFKYEVLQEVQQAAEMTNLSPDEAGELAIEKVIERFVNIQREQRQKRSRETGLDLDMNIFNEMPIEAALQEIYERNAEEDIEDDIWPGD